MRAVLAIPDGLLVVAALLLIAGLLALGVVLMLESDKRRVRIDPHAEPFGDCPRPFEVPPAQRGIIDQNPRRRTGGGW